jgi:hypothetical protein
MQSSAGAGDNRESRWHGQPLRGQRLSHLLPCSCARTAAGALLGREDAIYGEQLLGARALALCHGRSAQVKEVGGEGLT